MSPHNSWSETIEDPDFQQRAATELCEALGVSSHLIAEIPRLGEAATAYGDQEEALSSEEFTASMDLIGRSALPLAREILTRLREERIRPELVGMSSAGISHVLTQLESEYRSGAWRGDSPEEFEARMAQVESERVRTTPVKPQRGEVKRIVAVLRRMPKETVTQVTKVWHPWLLGAEVRLALRMLRKGAAAETAEATDADRNAEPADGS